MNSFRVFFNKKIISREYFIMENLKNHIGIKEFLNKYPYELQDACLLGLCSLGIDHVKSKKIDLIDYISEKFKISPLNSLHNKIIELKQEISKIQSDLPSSKTFGYQSPSSNSIMITPEKTKNPILDVSVEKLGIPIDSPKAPNFIEIADSFLSQGLIKEIYQKEIIAERLKVPFRKKWDEACEKIKVQKHN